MIRAMRKLLLASVLVLSAVAFAAAPRFAVPRQLPPGSAEEALCGMEEDAHNVVNGTLTLASDVSSGELKPGKPAQRTLRVRKGQCYLLLAAASAKDASLTLKVKGSGAEEDTEGQEERAAADFCADRTGTVTLELAAAKRTRYALALYVRAMPEDGPGSIGLRPSVAVLSTRGLRLDRQPECFGRTKSLLEEVDGLEGLEGIK
jgi:hypothetical protein